MFTKNIKWVKKIEYSIVWKYNTQNVSAIFIKEDEI